MTDVSNTGNTETVRELENENTDPVGGSTNGAGNSLFDLIRQEADELASSKEVYIRVPGYEKSRIHIKYGMPDSGKVLDDIGRKVERDNKDRYYRSLWTATDIMIALCEGIYVLPDGVDEYVMLDPGDTGQPVRFDSRLAKMVGLEDNVTARVIVRKLFGNVDMAILDHFERLQRWLTNTKADLTSQVWQLGE
jgi:hypothetical protein